MDQAADQAGAVPAAGERSGSAREAVLRRVRAALADRPGPVAVPRDYDRTREAADPLALLAERIEDYRAMVHRVQAAELPARITASLAARGARRMAAPVDLPADWLVPEVAWRLDTDHSSTIEELDGIDGVLTGCAVAVAETGTLVLDAGEAQGRRMLTLLPDYHLCVVRADQVAVSLPEALARLDGTRPLTFVSGPSATSDIELNRVEGVHGPRTLEVVIVDA
ncbi:LutC/YkgG family protein [Actinoalloteichus hoggarensis]|uniref:LutC/YkgG family protein n=1 Tax=Actinoalloteichus hoggarensis TaxID=1470176 RepID=UPI000B8B329B